MSDTLTGNPMSSPTPSLPAAIREALDAYALTVAQYEREKSHRTEAASRVLYDAEHAARIALEAHLLALVNDAENRNNQALSLIHVLEFHGKRAAEMGDACLEVATQLRGELAERRLAARTPPEDTAVPRTQPED